MLYRLPSLPLIHKENLLNPNPLLHLPPSLHLSSVYILVSIGCRIPASSVVADPKVKVSRISFFLCPNRLSSIWEQLGCLESIFLHLEKRTDPCQEKLAVCITRHIRKPLSSVVALGNLP